MVRQELMVHVFLFDFTIIANYKRDRYVPSAFPVNPASTGGK